MTLKTCYRCDWQGETTKPKCPHCGVPLYVVGAVPSGGMGKPVKTNPEEQSREEARIASIAPSDTWSLQTNPSPSPTDAIEQPSRPDDVSWPQQEKRELQANRNKKIGGLAVAAAIGLAGFALILGGRDGENSKTPVAEPPTVHQPDLSVASSSSRRLAHSKGSGRSPIWPTTRTSGWTQPPRRKCRCSPPSSKPRATNRSSRGMLRNAQLRP